MSEVFDYAVVLILIIGFTYGLVKQIQHTLSIQKSNNTDNYKRSLLGNYLLSISLAGFILSYVFNGLVALQIIQSNIITSNSTSLICIAFLVFSFIFKFAIIPKNSKQTPFLNNNK